MKGGYFLLNGQFYKEQDAVFRLADLDCLFEGFSETFRAEHNEILFQKSISNHLLATAESIGVDLTGLIDPDGRMLRKDVSRLLNKNKLYQAARIGIQIYPSDSQVNILLRAEETERGYYPIKEPGLLLSFYYDHLKGIQPSAAYSTSGFFISQGAKRMAAALNQSNMILLNSEKNCCECIDGSFAYLNNEEVIFPALGSGGYRCAILEEIIHSALRAGFKPKEQETITTDDLLDAEELFLFDTCNGIQKVLGLEERRYYSTKTQLIARELSELAKKDREEKT